MRWLALALVVGFAIGCGGSPPPIDWEGRLKAENQITALWTQIRGWRHDAHMDLDPVRTDVFQMSRRTVPEARRVCSESHEVPPRCTDTCELSGHICDNAEAICDIAASLGPQDDWAQEKCTSAKASCREAKQKCCNCSKAPPEAP